MAPAPRLRPWARRCPLWHSADGYRPGRCRGMWHFRHLPAVPRHIRPAPFAPRPHTGCAKHPACGRMCRRQKARCLALHAWSQTPRPRARQWKRTMRSCQGPRPHPPCLQPTAKGCPLYRARRPTARHSPSPGPPAPWRWQGRRFGRGGQTATGPRRPTPAAPARWQCLSG